MFLEIKSNQTLYCPNKKNKEKINVNIIKKLKKKKLFFFKKK
ncbi:MAG: hypothetical protein QMC32_01275 [Cytophagales bacterium]|jgi:hypothetical protein|tara:strand:+ start:397 stop:522 length:126 start_codon:yes stop_codon:yes gene_type:complete